MKILKPILEYLNLNGINIIIFLIFEFAVWTSAPNVYAGIEDTLILLLIVFGIGLESKLNGEASWLNPRRKLKPEEEEIDFQI